MPIEARRFATDDDRCWEYVVATLHSCQQAKLRKFRIKHFTVSPAARWRPNRALKVFLPKRQPFQVGSSVKIRRGSAAWPSPGQGDLCAGGLALFMYCGVLLLDAFHNMHILGCYPAPVR